MKSVQPTQSLFVPTAYKPPGLFTACLTEFREFLLDLVVMADCHSLLYFTCSCKCLHPFQVSLIFPSVLIPVFPVSLCQFILYVSQVNQRVFPVLLLLFSF